MADAAEKSVLSKLSWRLLPLIALGYGISFMDRVNISFAALQMNHDLHFSATIYGLGGGLFFVSYALFEVPSNLLLVRFGARRWIARIMLTWGALAAGMMFVRTPLQFYVMRFLLGLAEAGFFPGIILYLSHWFPAGYRGRAISRFYIAWPLSSVFMGAVAGALLNLQGRLGLAGWQWLFLLEGLPAVAMSVVVFRLLPDRPRDAPWLSQGEAEWIETRLANEAAAIGGAHHHGWGILRNPLVLQLAAINFLVLGSYYAFNLSAPIILNDITHFGAAGVGYLVAAASLLGAGTMLFNGWHADMRRERYYHLTVPLLLMAGAYAVMSATASPLLFTASYFAVIMGNMAVVAVIWLLPGFLIPPRAMAVSVAAINAIGQSGSAVSPYLWGFARDHTGSIHLGLSLLPLPYLLAAAIVLWMRRGANAGSGASP
ncbi:MAG TPA: MFS transporter [Rhizomicrobium sp.]|jgi:ACS family tartrate transporter-like MFS transporter|nr:MFS transporter [Rhizomicrobium sp.]